MESTLLLYRSIFILLSWNWYKPATSPLLAYLLKSGTSQSKPETAKTAPKNYEATRNDLKFQNLGNLEFPASFRFLNFESKFPKLGILGQKVLTFQSYKNFTCTLFWMCWFQICHLFSKIVSPNPQICAFWTIKYLFLTKFCLYPISRGLISYLNFVFQNFGIS